MIDKGCLIFEVDGQFYNENGEKIPEEERFHKKTEDNEKDEWRQYWMEYEGLNELLKVESTAEPLCEIATDLRPKVKMCLLTEWSCIFTLFLLK